MVGALETISTANSTSQRSLKKPEKQQEEEEVDPGSQEASNSSYLSLSLSDTVNAALHSVYRRMPAAVHSSYLAPNHTGFCTWEKPRQPGLGPQQSFFSQPSTYRSVSQQSAEGAVFDTLKVLVHHAMVGPGRRGGGGGGRVGQGRGGREGGEGGEVCAHLLIAMNILVGAGWA